MECMSIFWKFHIVHFNAPCILLPCIKAQKSGFTWFWFLKDDFPSEIEEFSHIHMAIKLMECMLLDLQHCLK